MPSVSVQKREKQEQFIKEQRDAIFRAAGIDLDRRMRVLRKAYDRLDEQLDAKKLFMVNKEAVEITDNAARLRAIEQVVDLEGVSLGKQHEGGSGGPVTITINAPWFEPGPTTGSGEGAVIEHGPANLLIDNES